MSFARPNNYCLRLLGVSNFSYQFPYSHQRKLSKHSKLVVFHAHGRISRGTGNRHELNAFSCPINTCIPDPYKKVKQIKYVSCSISYRITQFCLLFQKRQNYLQTRMPGLGFKRVDCPFWCGTCGTWTWTTTGPSDVTKDPVKETEI